MSLPLKNKVAVVTGAGSGIGRKVTEKLARMGATVVATDVNETSAMETVQTIQAENKSGLAKKLDVTSQESIKQTFEEVYNYYGSIDILINNAGVSTMQSIEKLTEEEWDFNFNINTKGVYLCTQHVLPYMKKNKEGKIVNTASMAGKRGVPLLAHYAASKWAVIGFTKSVAIEVAQYNITVNCVCPGYVKTSMQERELAWEAELRNMTPQEVKEEYIRNTPLGRLETAEDVAKAIGFLASPEADFITGEALDVTGGADLV